MVHVRYGVFAAMAAAGCVIGLGRGDVARDEMQRQVDAGLIAGGVAACEGMEPVCVGLARVAPDRTPVRTDTLFDVASLTKTFTADGRDAGIEMLLNKLVTEDEELAALFQAKRGKIEPWLGRAASPLHDDPVATKMLFLVYNALFPQD